MAADITQETAIPLHLEPFTEYHEEPYSVVTGIARAVAEQGGRLFIAGGYVRDAVIASLHNSKHPAKDLDLEVYGIPFQQLHALLAPFGAVNLVGASFQVLKLTLDTAQVLDITIPRRDSRAVEGHRGIVSHGDPELTLREASRRRDVTVNALLLEPLSGAVFDPWNGFDDIQNRRLRAVDPETFGEDPLRVLRLAQLHSRLEFEIEPETAELARSIGLGSLSRERIGEEWHKLLLYSARPSLGLSAAKSLRILEQLHPELEVLSEIPQVPEWHPEGTVWDHTMFAVDAAARIIREEPDLNARDKIIVLFGALTHDLGKATTTKVRIKKGAPRITSYNHETTGAEIAGTFLKNLAMPQKIITAIQHITREHLYHVHSPSPSDAAIRRFALRLQPATIRLWDLITRADADGRGQEYQPYTRPHRIYLRAKELGVESGVPVPLIQGRHLLPLGIKPGPEMGRILQRLYTAQLEDKFLTVEQGMAYYAKHLQGRGKPGI